MIAAEHIREIAREYNPDDYITNSAVAYIQSLFVTREEAVTANNRYDHINDEAELIKYFKDFRIYNNDQNIFPWDIAESFFGRQFDDKMPVEVTVGDNTFTHLLSSEFILGLHLFCNESDFDCRLSMYGHELEFMADSADMRLMDNESPFIVEIGDKGYLKNALGKKEM